jgi:hypothetical protein
MSPRPLFLHVGASKTGTSSLQRGLFGSVAELGAQGVGVPLRSREEHIREVLRPLGWVTASGFVEPAEPGRLGRLRPRLRRAAGDRLLMTCEDLCEADPDRIRMLVEALAAADIQPRVILTLRNLGSVIPSEWQQFLKHRMTLDYPTFLERIRDHQGRWARHFWQRQDAVAICRRWLDAVGSERLDVVVTPSRSRDPEGLYRHFGDVVGFDHSALSWPGRDVNASWGYREAELYRRLNASLGSRLRRYERDYQRAVRWPLVRGALPRGASNRIPLPPEHLPWVTETARAQVAWLRDTGVRVHGDAAELVPDPGSAAPLPELDEAEIAQAAVDTLANYAVRAHRSARRRRPRGRGGRTSRLKA